MSRYMMSELTCLDNDNDALVPQLWAFTALRTLGSNLVMGALVNRDYSDSVQGFGDVVNTSRPADFTGKRKTDDDSVVVQDAVSPNIPVPLDQHVHVSFVIKDGEMSKAFPDLVTRYLEPAAREMAEKVDQILLGQTVRLASNTEGRLGEMDDTNATEFLLDSNVALDVNRAPRSGRNLVLGPRAHGTVLKSNLVVSADRRGDEGTALRDASVGRIYGLDTFMDQNASYVDPAKADSTAGTVTGAEVSGEAGSITVSIVGYEVQVGDYIVVEGDGEAYEVSAATVGAGDTTAVTVLGATQHPWAAAAVITAYETQASQGAYVKGYQKDVIIDGQAAGKELQAGQWVSYGTGALRHSYTVISADTTAAGESTVLLDRPLDLAVADNDNVHAGPAGGMNIAFHKDALALVIRPLAQVPSGKGADSVVVSDGDISMRVTMQYQGHDQGMLVTFDLLCGTAVLDDRLAVVMYS